MKEIKTLVCPISSPEWLDKKTNELLTKGWKIVGRFTSACAGGQLIVYLEKEVAE